MKRSYSDHEKNQHLSQWRASGQSMKSYSAAAGLCYQTFYNWAKAWRGSGPEEGPGFLPVSLQGAPPEEKPRAEVDLGDGVVLRVY